MSTSGKDFLWSLCAALCLVVLNGYWFNCYDQEEHLPQVYKLLNPELYRGDYFVDASTSHFTIRWFYVKTVYVFSFFMGVEYAVLLLFLLCLTFSILLIKKIAFHFSQNNSIAIIISFFVPLIFNRWTTGGNAILDTQLLGSSFAYVGCLAAFYFYLKEKYLFSAICAGIASWYQLLMGLHLALIFTLCLFLLQPRQKLKTSFTYFITWIAFASPMLIPVLVNQFVKQDYNKDFFYEALFFFRNPHHYIPSHFALTDYFKTCALMIAACLIAIRSNHTLRKFVVAVNMICLIGMLTYYLLFEIAGFYEIGKLQWFKVTVWMTLINGVIICSYVLHHFQQLKKLNLYQNKFSILSIIAVVSLFSFLFVLKNFLPSSIHTRYHLGNYPKSELTITHEWIKNNTKLNAVVMSFPNDESALCEAQRPVHIAFKAIIHEPWFLIKWMQKFKKSYGVTNTYSIDTTFSLQEIDRGYYFKNQNNLKHVDYFIVENNSINDSRKTDVYKNKSYSVIHNRR